MHSTNTYISGVLSGNSAHVKGKLSREIENLFEPILPIISSNKHIPSAYMSFSINISSFSLSVKFPFLFYLANGHNDPSYDIGKLIEVAGRKSVNLNINVS